MKIDAFYDAMDIMLQEIDVLIDNMMVYKPSEVEFLIWILPWFIQASKPPRLKYRHLDMAYNLK